MTTQGVRLLGFRSTTGQRAREPRPVESLKARQAEVPDRVRPSVPERGCLRAASGPAAMAGRVRPPRMRGLQDGLAAAAHAPPGHGRAPAGACETGWSKWTRPKCRCARSTTSSPSIDSRTSARRRSSARWRPMRLVVRTGENVRGFVKPRVQAVGVPSTSPAGGRRGQKNGLRT